MNDPLVDLLMRNGFVAPEEEAAELRAAGGDLDALVARRLTGEPLAWITGTVEFCGRTILIQPGVYVPRWHTESVAWRAVARMPRGGTGIDLCTGFGRDRRGADRGAGRADGRHRPRPAVRGVRAGERRGRAASVTCSTARRARSTS